MGTKSSGKKAKAKAKKNSKPAPKPSSKKHKKENTATTKTQPPPISKNSKKEGKAAAKPTPQLPTKKSKKPKSKPKAAVKQESKWPSYLGPPPSFGSALGTGMIDIKVGQAKTEFKLHKNILFEKTHLLYDHATQSGFLPEEDPAIFSLFIEWLYTEKIQQSINAVLNKSERIAKERSLRMERVKLYGFGLKFNIVPLMDFVMTEFMRVCGRGTLEYVEYAYATFPPGPFRKLMVHCLAHNLTDTYCHTFAPGLSKTEYSAEVSRLVGHFDSLRADLVGFMMDCNGSFPIQDPLSLNPCMFHLHDRDPFNECKAKKK